MNIILAHRQLDFDALASMVAAQKLYHESIMVIDGKSNPYVQDFLSIGKDRLPMRKPQDIELSEVSRVILVDTHDLRRTGNLGEKLAKLPDLKVEIYDHHPYNGKPESNWRIEPLGACTTLLVEEIEKLGLPLSSFEATLLALGIYDDTGSLLFENTTVRDIRAVAYLLEQGANLGVVGEYLRKPLTEEQKSLLQELIDHGQTELFKGTPVYLSYTEIEDYVGGLALLAHRVGEMEGAETWFLVVKMENRVYIVGRSRGKGLPVNQVLGQFGGSGHVKAASAVLKGTDVRNVLAKLREEIINKVHKPQLAKEIMSFPIKTVSPDTKLSEVQRLLLRYGHTGVPVVDEQRKLIGIISRRDVEKAVKHGLEHAPVKGFMTKDVITVSSQAGWDEVQKLMVQHDIGRLPVVEEGKVVGIISRSDVLRIVHGSAVPIETALARERSLAVRQDILDLLGRLPPKIRSLLETVRKAADDARCSVFIVGGFVRDLLLLVPTKDMDFVVEGSGTEFAKKLHKQLSDGELTIHEQFGTARISFSDDTHLDVASTRWEYYDFPGALPEVEESCLRDDLFRRDFTINSLAICLNSERYGELVDYYGGVRDLEQGEIRLLHNLSFIEDPTRILRAIRFAKRYRFVLAQETMDALTVALQAGVLRRLSLERFTEELLLVYKENNYTFMGQALVDLGIFAEWFEKEYPWNFNEQDDIERERFEVRWLISLSKMELTQIEEVLNRLKVTRKLRQNTMEYINLKSTLKKSNLSLIEIDRLFIRSSEWIVNLLMQDGEIKDLLEDYKEALSNIKMKADGNMLTEMGIKEGPLIGKILRQVREAWLEGKIHSENEEKKFLYQLILLNR